MRNARMYLHYGFHQVWYQGIVRATGSGVLEDLTATTLEQPPKSLSVLLEVQGTCHSLYIE